MRRNPNLIYTALATLDALLLRGEAFEPACEYAAGACMVEFEELRAAHESRRIAAIEFDLDA